MAEAFTPALRALVVAALLLATTALMLAVVSTAQAAGALAVASCGAFGEAFDFASVAGARQNALAKCQAENCRVVTTVRRGCTAFAVHLTICGPNGWGQAPKLGGSQNASLRSCHRDGGKECVIRTFSATQGLISAGVPGYPFELREFSNTCQGFLAVL